MKKIIVFLCLVLAGCVTITKDSKAPHSAKSSEAVVIDQKEIEELISVFSEAIKQRPDYAGAYYNRAVAYFYKHDYDLSWQDIHSAEQLGINVDAKFIELVDKLKKASGRER